VTKLRKLLQEEYDGDALARNMKSNRSIPDCSVIPELAYPDVRAAALWLCNAFGFRERLEIGGHRAQLVFGNGALVVIEGKPANENSHAVLVRVDGIDQHYEKAKQFGAQIIRTPTDYPYGERQYSAADFAGHIWTFSESIADVDPAEWGGKLKL
jgi:uncharacterized glyoxalase superfamily protein PhnB